MMFSCVCTNLNISLWDFSACVTNYIFSVANAVLPIPDKLSHFIAKQYTLNDDMVSDYYGIGLAEILGQCFDLESWLGLQFH